MGAQVLLVPLKVMRFVLLARLLGIEQFGLLTSATALISFAAPFSGWGYGSLLTRFVARDTRSFPLWWGNSLLLLAVTGVPLTIAMVLCGPLFLQDTTVMLMLALAGSDLILSRIIDMAERAYRSHWKMAQAAMLTLMGEISRVSMLVPFIWIGTRTAEGWAYWQLLGAAVAGVPAVLLTNAGLGAPRPSWTSARAYLYEGAHFAIGHSAGTAYMNLDRVMLARLSTLDATGIYSAASGLLMMAKVPVGSLSRAMMPRYFELGGKSVTHTMQFARHNIQAGLGYAVPVSIAIWLGAPLLPFILGSEYAASVGAIRWLAILPALFVLSDVAGMAVSAIDRPQDRTKALVLVAALNVVLNALLIPHYSWRGAAWATVASEAVLGVTLWAIMLFWNRRLGNSSIASGSVN